MNRYNCKRIRLEHYITPEEYNKAVEQAEITVCNGIKEVAVFCGGKPIRYGTGLYGGTDGTFDYIIERI